MEKIGYKRGVYNPCTYYHAGRKLHTMVHGDDYCSVGERKNIELFKNKLSSRFSIKTTIVGNIEMKKIKKFES